MNIGVLNGLVKCCLPWSWRRCLQDDIFFRNDFNIEILRNIGIGSRFWKLMNGEWVRIFLNLTLPSNNRMVPYPLLFFIYGLLTFFYFRVKYTYIYWILSRWLLGMGLYRKSNYYQENTSKQMNCIASIFPGWISLKWNKSAWIEIHPRHCWKHCWKGNIRKRNNTIFFETVGLIWLQAILLDIKMFINLQSRSGIWASQPLVENAQHHSTGQARPEWKDMAFNYIVTHMMC